MAKTDTLYRVACSVPKQRVVITPKMTLVFAF
jgi:hypothetical protein